MMLVLLYLVAVILGFVEPPQLSRLMSVQFKWLYPPPRHKKLRLTFEEIRMLRSKTRTRLLGVPKNFIRRRRTAGQSRGTLRALVQTDSSLGFPTIFIL